MATPNYSAEAQIHSLSLLSNAAFDLQESSLSQLQSLTEEIVSKTLTDTSVISDIGSWTQIWGPIVFSNSPSAAKVVADNTMMLLYNNAQNLFVVAIAGTNAVSAYGWLQEDFQVNTEMGWQGIVNKPMSGYPAISGGSYTGLKALLAMTGTELTTSSSNQVTMLTALNDYIRNNNVSSAEIAVAGHSLGGALAPVMAMYMQDTLSNWNTAGNVKTIAAWPTAGPTPGNQTWATYVAASMGSNYTSKYNTLDVIPQAWQSSSMSTIPQIYGSNIPYPETTAPYSTTMGTLVTAAFLRTFNTGAYPSLPIVYTQVQPWTALTGTFDTDTDTAAQNLLKKATIFEPSGLSTYIPYLEFLVRFLEQMFFQHTTAYDTLLGISDFAAQYTQIKDEVTGSTKDSRRMAAFATALKKYYGMPDFTALKVVTPQHEAVLV